MHTGEAALKHRRLAGKDGLHIDLIHLTALLGACYILPTYSYFPQILINKYFSLHSMGPRCSHTRHPSRTDYAS